MFSPGDLVRQAQNIFANRKIGGKPMMVIQTWGNGIRRVDVLIDGDVITFHEGELEIHPFNNQK